MITSANLAASKNFLDQHFDGAPLASGSNRIKILQVEFGKVFELILSFRCSVKEDVSLDSYLINKILVLGPVLQILKAMYF